MRIIELEGTKSNDVLVFKVASKQDNVKFLDINNALNDLGELYKQRHLIRKRKFVDKGILSQEFGNPFR